MAKVKLYFLRHGSAEERSHSLRDFDRRLTPEGVDEMRRVAAGLARLVEVDQVISSPLPRALETAEIAAAALGATRVSVDPELASGAFDIAALRRLTADLPGGHRLLLVGHEPDFSSVVRELTGAAIEMKKAGVAFVDTRSAAAGSGVLRWLLTPRQLELIAAAESDGPDGS